MKIDADDFRRHFASLADDALLAVDRTQLVETARECYDDELSRRELSAGGGGAQPGWLDDAACVFTCGAQHGRDAVSEAEEARSALEASGIPSHIAVLEVETPGAPSRREFEYQILVPGPLVLEALSVLDKEILNAQLEDEWRTHFEALTDEDLSAIQLPDLMAGLLDKVERLKKTYQDELTRRGLEPASAE